MEDTPLKPLDLAEFMSEYEGLDGPDEKLRFAMEGMRSAISQEGSANFKAFWEIRSLATDLFKEAINPALRAHYFAEYRELSQEARRLKELVNQESAFASEAMEGAIAGLEAEVAALEAGEAKGERLAPPEGESVVQRHFDKYVDLQAELLLLNAYASRIQALRKELISLEIRVRHKNKFFERLSKLGDRVYPRRKERMNEVSDLFLEDVDHFIEKSFSGGQPCAPLYVLRDQIKALQGFAKQITLTTPAFSKSRKRLSECWDVLREEGRKRKAEHAEKRDLFRENLDALLKKLDDLSEKVDDPEVTSEVSSRSLDGIMREAKESELGPQERSDLRDKMGGIRKKLYARVKEEEGERKRRDAERSAELEAKIAALEESPDESALLALEEVVGKLSPSERAPFQGRVSVVRQLLVDLEEERLLESEPSSQLLEMLQERRRGLKSHYEEVRKAGGGSGLDFEQAMAYRDALDRDRARIERLDGMIAKLEKQLR